MTNEATDKGFPKYIELEQHQKNNPIKKWAEDLNRHFFKEDIQIAKNTSKDAQHYSLLQKCKSN